MNRTIQRVTFVLVGAGCVVMTAMAFVQGGMTLEVPAWQAWMALPIAFIGGICGGVWGIGAGWVVVPPLLLLGVPAPIAVGCSVVHMAVKSIYPVVKDWRELDWSPGGTGRLVAVPMTLGSVLAVAGGVFLLSWAKARQSAPAVVGVSYCVLLALIVAYGLYSRFSRKTVAGEMLSGWAARVITFAVGLVTGVLAGMLGVGGGLVRRPALTYFIRTREKRTGPIGQLAALVTSAFGLVLHWHEQNVDWVLAGLLCVGGFFGQAIGNAWRRPLLEARMTNVPKATYLVAATGLLVSQILHMADLERVGQVFVVCLGVALAVAIAASVSRARRALKPKTG